MKEDNNIEIKGYEILSNTFGKISKYLNYPAAYFARLSGKINFEKYKIIFGERDDDIYVTTYPKSGTTLMQMILYHLTTDGDMGFKHIYDVSPWIHNASYKGQQPIELPSPRIIKTHDFYKDFPKKIKGKFIYVYRDGKDVALSFYNQQKNYSNQKLTFDTFLKNSFKSKEWFKYTKAWLKNKNKLPVLYIRYEDLLNNKRTEIDKIIAFCNLNSSEEAINRAMEYSSFSYMKKHEDKFGDQPVEKKIVYNQFIRKGKSGEGQKYFTENQKLTYDKYYNKMVKQYENKAFSVE